MSSRELLRDLKTVPEVTERGADTDPLPGVPFGQTVKTGCAGTGEDALADPTLHGGLESIAIEREGKDRTPRTPVRNVFRGEHFLDGCFDVTDDDARCVPAELAGRDLGRGFCERLGVTGGVTQDMMPSDTRMLLRMALPALRNLPLRGGWLSVWCRHEAGWNAP